MEAGTLMAISDGWLDTQTNGTAPSYMVNGTSLQQTNCGDYWWVGTHYCYQYPYYPIYYSSPERPIKLTLSEIERLRKAAKDDAKLKSILQKFTGQIEITVDFE